MRDAHWPIAKGLLNDTGRLIVRDLDRMEAQMREAGMNTKREESLEIARAEKCDLVGWGWGEMEFHLAT